MSRDITENLPLDLSISSATAALLSNTGVEYDYAFNGLGFIDFTNGQHPYRRETAQYRKEQQDNSAEPGEQSLTGWWLRSQSSFHYGAGAKYYEPTQDQNLRFKFEDSDGVNVWTLGEVSLLKKMNVVSGFSFASTHKGNLRTISTGVLVHGTNDVYRVNTDGTSVHLVDFTANVFSITDDGKYLYWIANIGGKKTLYRKPLDATGSPTTDSTLNGAVKLYEHPSSPTPSNTYMEFAKDRIFIASGNELYYFDLDNSTTSATRSGVFYKTPNPDFVFDCITESPSDVYISGYQGSRSVIYRVVFIPDANDIPVPTTVQVVAELPLGEQIYFMKYYLGYVLLGTSLGVRVAAIKDDGGIVYGPLLFRSDEHVHHIATYDRFAYATTGIGADMGLTRIDLSVQLDNLVFPYAKDLRVEGVTSDTLGVAFINDTGRIAIASATNLYFESATEYRTSGFLTTGRIRFNTLENKYFKYIKERADHNGGSINISVDGSLITSTSDTAGNQDVGITARQGMEFQQYTFTLNRGTTTTTPTLFGYQVKALPAVKKQRLIQIPLRCYNFDTDRNGNQFGFEGAALARISVFETLEESADIVNVQDFRTGESYQALIEECSFVSDTTSSRISGNFGGLLTVTVRKI
jgi:hypothetical protein